MDEQGIDSIWTLASLCDNYIAAICIVIRKPGSLVSNKTPDMGYQIYILAIKNLKQECENRKLVFEMSEFDERSNQYKVLFDGFLIQNSSKSESEPLMGVATQVQ